MTRLNYVHLARTLRREGFVATHDHGFLVARQELRSPVRAQTTAVYHAYSPGLLPGAEREWTPGPIVDDEAAWIVAPVKKQQTAFPSMVAVGRTANNDIVVNDESVSKFHAHFRRRPAGFELTDASSRNGTFVNGKPLPARGPGVVVQPGDIIRFGRVEFTLLDAAGCWKRLRSGV